MAALAHALFLLVFVVAAPLPTRLALENPVAAASIMGFAFLGGLVLLGWGAEIDLWRMKPHHKREKPHHRRERLPASTSARHYGRLRRAWGEKARPQGLR